jgi:hypothetical protein
MMPQQRRYDKAAAYPYKPLNVYGYVSKTNIVHHATESTTGGSSFIGAGRFQKGLTAAAPKIAFKLGDVAKVLQVA